MPGKRHIHTAKFRRCVKAVSKAKGYNPYAVCAASIPSKERFVKGVKKVHGMPVTAIEKMVKNPRTPKHLRAYWQNQLKKLM